MTPAEGMQRLMFHTQPEPGSFLHMLRPYRGLDANVMRDVSQSLRACAERFLEEQIPRELVSAAWALSHLGRLWALEPEGMLRRNGLITDEDLATLTAFLDRFEHAVMMLLERAPDAAFSGWTDDA
jgi:hypothetical protein